MDRGQLSWDGMGHRDEGMGMGMETGVRDGDGHRDVGTGVGDGDGHRDVGTGVRDGDGEAGFTASA